MTILAFPPVEHADEHGLLAVGGDLELESLLLAYRNGIFPWPLDQDTLAWFSPPMRTVLFLDKLHVAQSLRKEQRRTHFSFAFNRNFRKVVAHCAEVKNRGKQRGTWITPDIVDAYSNLHAAGFCHSAECYDKEDLVGGLYGVSLAGMFAGESMFYRKPNASKLAFLFLCDYLIERQVEWIDCQVMTPFLASFGAQEISRADFMKLLSQSLRREVQLFSAAPIAKK